MEAHRSEQVAVAAQGAHGAPGAEAHPSRARTYFLIFVVLVVVTAAEVAVTYFPAIPQAPTLILLAALKFFLIASIYMHLRYDSRVFSAFFMVGLFLATGMLISFMALFTAHPRLPVSATAPTPAPTTGTPVASGTSGTSGTTGSSGGAGATPTGTR
jgi:cytochrome c oxidase subunit 4